MKLTPLTKVIRASIGASLLLTAAMPVMAQNATPELSIAPFVFSMFVIMAIVNIVLFFKIWKMTNTVENIFNLALIILFFDLNVLHLRFLNVFKPQLFINLI